MLMPRKQVVPIDTGRTTETACLEDALQDDLDGLYRFALRLTRNADEAQELALLDQLRAIFGVFAIMFAVKSRVSIAALGKNGRVKTKCLPFAHGDLAVCSQHVSAQHPSQKRRQRSSLLQHRRKPSHRFPQDGTANRSLSRRDQRPTTSGLAQVTCGV